METDPLCFHGHRTLCLPQMPPEIGRTKTTAKHELHTSTAPYAMTSSGFFRGVGQSSSNEGLLRLRADSQLIVLKKTRLSETSCDSPNRKLTPKHSISIHPLTCLMGTFR